MDTFPKQTIFNVLQNIGSNPITYENALIIKKRALLLENQVNYVEDIIVKRETANLGISRKEVIQVISELGQEKLFVQSENHLYYLIKAKRMTHLKRLGKVVAAEKATI